MSSRYFKGSLLALVLAVLILVGCSGLDAGMVAQPAGEIYRSPQGLEVQSLKDEYKAEEANEVAKILDIHRWKFNLTPPDSQTNLNYQLELQNPQGETKVLSSLSMTTGETGPVDGILAFYPLEGSIFNSEKLKVFIESGGGSMSQVLENPFQGFSGFGPENPAKLDQDGRFLLARFSQEDSQGIGQDSLLYFRVQPVN